MNELNSELSNAELKKYFALALDHADMIECGRVLVLEHLANLMDDVAAAIKRHLGD